MLARTWRIHHSVHVQHCESNFPKIDLSTRTGLITACSQSKEKPGQCAQVMVRRATAGPRCAMQKVD